MLFLFFKSVLKSAVGLLDLTRELMLSQGIYIRPPMLSMPDKVDFVKRQHFLAGFIGEKRPLTAQEVTILFNNVQTNSIGKTLIIGFAQIAKHKDVKDYFLRGKKLSEKHIEIFTDILMKEDLPAPMAWDTSLSDSTEPIFSDKLMMFHVSGMTAAGVTNYGAAISGSPRRDLALRFASLIPEVVLYAEDGVNIMINHGWMEEPPQTIDRNI